MCLFCSWPRTCLTSAPSMTHGSTLQHRLSSLAAKPRHFTAPRPIVLSPSWDALSSIDSATRPICDALGFPVLRECCTTSWDALGFTERQIATYNRSFAMASDSILSATTQILGAKHMLVQSHVGYGSAAALPSNQWILELGNWFRTMMTNLQLRSLQYATGPGNSWFFE